MTITAERENALPLHKVKLSGTCGVVRVVARHAGVRKVDVVILEGVKGVIAGGRIRRMTARTILIEKGMVHLVGLCEATEQVVHGVTCGHHLHASTSPEPGSAMAIDAAKVGLGAAMGGREVAREKSLEVGALGLVKRSVVIEVTRYAELVL